MSDIQIGKRLTAIQRLQFTSTKITSFSTVAAVTLDTAIDSLFNVAVAGSQAPTIHGVTKLYCDTTDTLFITMYYSYEP